MAVLTPDNPVAERIRAANRRRPLGGMAGALQMVSAASDPRTYKRLAAESLIYLRANRAACRALGRNHLPADAWWLARAARCRRFALELAPQPERKEAR